MSKDKIRDLYEFFFKLADADGDGFVSGSEAASLFRKSGLSDESLRNVWAQVSQGQPNLNKSAFFMALGLIALVQSGKEPKLTDLGVGKMLAPTFAGITPPGTQLSLMDPEVLNTSRSPGSSMGSSMGGMATMTGKEPSQASSNVGSVGSESNQSVTMGSMGSVGSNGSVGNGSQISVTSSSGSSSSTSQVWLVPESQKPVSAGHFASLDVNGAGVIGGGEAKDFFMKSNLPSAELAKIWALSDVNGDGKLSLAEFQIAFYLTQQRMNLLLEIPSVLPSSLYESVGLNAPQILAAHPSPANSPAHSAPSSKTSSLLEMPSSSSVQQQNALLNGEGGQTSSFSSLPNPTSHSPNPATSPSSPLPQTSSSSSTTSPNAPRGSDFRLTVKMDPSELREAMANFQDSSYNQSSQSSSNQSSQSSSNPSSQSQQSSSFMPTSNGSPSSIPSHLQTTSPSSSDWIITSDVKSTYDHYFAKADEMMSGYVAGPKARELFLKASLPNSTLADIWALSESPWKLIQILIRIMLMKISSNTSDLSFQTF